MRYVTYDKQTYDNPNPLARFAHRRRYQHALSLALDSAGPRATIVDYGAGWGDFLHRLAVVKPDSRLIGIESNGPLAYPELETRASMEEFEDESVDCLCAFEVLEHLDTAHIERFIEQARRICKLNARILISVPIMKGLALPVKEASRSLLYRRFSDHSVGELIRGTLGLEVARTDRLLHSHKGFDHVALFRRFTRDFRNIRRFHSPMPRLPWWCNSQAFFVFSRQ